MSSEGQRAPDPGSGSVTFKETDGVWQGWVNVRRGNYVDNVGVRLKRIYPWREIERKAKANRVHEWPFQIISVWLIVCQRMEAGGACWGVVCTCNSVHYSLIVRLHKPATQEVQRVLFSTSIRYSLGMIISTKNNNWESSKYGKHQGEQGTVNNSQEFRNSEDVQKQ